MVVPVIAVVVVGVMILILGVLIVVVGVGWMEAMVMTAVGGPGVVGLGRISGRPILFHTLLCPRERMAPQIWALGWGAGAVEFW